jgi:hypothetical protein
MFGRWSVVVALASAQFIMVLGSTMMNVSIQKVIDELRGLKTAVGGIALAGPLGRRATRRPPKEPLAAGDPAQAAAA